MKNLFALSALLLSLVAIIIGFSLLIDATNETLYSLKWFYNLTASIGFFALGFTLNLTNHYALYERLRMWRLNVQSRRFRRRAIELSNRHTKKAREIKES